MSGQVIRILEKKDYDFSSEGAGSVGPETALAIDVDVSEWREVTLLIRIHSLSITGGTGTPAKFTIVARASAPTDEDPASFFRDPAGTPMLSVDIPSTTVFPGLIRAPVPASCGAWITVLIKATQFAATVGSVKGTFSIDVSMKD